MSGVLRRNFEMQRSSCWPRVLHCYYPDARYCAKIDWMTFHGSLALHSCPKRYTDDIEAWTSGFQTCWTT
ncbi:hypothetical protein KC368_g27 [Hortaea werneckii]|nr:hypothetical protein KC368_g27 [Hortaea werneckii]